MVQSILPERPHCPSVYCRVRTSASNYKGIIEDEIVIVKASFYALKINYDIIRVSGWSTAEALNWEDNQVLIGRRSQR